MQLIKAEPIKIKMALVLELFQAQQTFGGYAKVMDGDKVATIPFDIGGLTRVAIGLNIKDLRPIVESYQAAVKELRAQHVPNESDLKNLTPPEQTAFSIAVNKFNLEVQLLLDAEAEINQRKLKLDDLRPDKNPFDPNLYAALDPILVYGNDKE